MDPLTAAREALAVHDAFHKACPHIPEIQEWGFLRAALDRVDELEAEVERLRGLLQEAVEASDALLFSGFIRVDAGNRMTARARMANVASYPTLAEVKKP